jgi:hypothetical protein
MPCAPALAHLILKSTTSDAVVSMFLVAAMCIAVILIRPHL